MPPEIWFPYLGIKIEKLDPVAFQIFGISVYWYGILIGLGVLAGLLVATKEAKRTGQNPEVYMDFLLYALIAAIIGARLYYVAFSWDEYKDNIMKIFATREGGLAIYGGVIGAVIAGVFYTKAKKIDFWVLADTSAPALILGQAIGRWGNFVNQEAFGGYTDSLFAMRLMKSNVYDIPQEVLNHIQILDGIEYIQVHPTFLYESLWNVGVFIFLIWYRRHKKFTGEVFMMYLLGYALGRIWIEGLRTDQLLIPHTLVPISQVVAGISIFFAIVFIIYKRKKEI
ncbi:MAG: prolipoprotein diacylglyceryl transferase [Epulopiscium sp.]|nr:prolipoprotein diacylglyceryl transferase [Candidatus Epulonipiscium sp.]